MFHKKEDCLAVYVFFIQTVNYTTDLSFEENVVLIHFFNFLRKFEDEFCSVLIIGKQLSSIYTAYYRFFQI